MSAEHNKLIIELVAIAKRLPTGLLARLVLDAKEFEAWSRGKRRSRGHGRLLQFERWKEKAEDKRFREIKRGYGG